MTHRQDVLARAFVEVADTLGDDIDVDGSIARLVAACGRVVPAADTGALAREPDGELRFAAASTEHLRLLERIVVPYDEGACLDCARSGAPVASGDLREARHRWPVFAAAAVEAGFVSVHALPLRWNGAVIGAVQLLLGAGDGADAADLALVQALADVATIAILHQRATVEARARADQLQGALASRVTIEQAKGMLAAHTGADPESAFETLRRYARTRNERLAEVAASIVDRSLPASTVAAS